MKKNIHIVSDEKMINKAVERFSFFYPKQNLFFIQVSRKYTGETRYVTLDSNIIPLKLSSRSSYKRIENIVENGDNIFIHFLNPVRAAIALRIKKKYKVNLYWIFYGADLYSMLNSKGVYQLFDNQHTTSNKLDLLSFLKQLYFSFLFKTNYFSVKENFIREVNYFCFWNHLDYELLVKNYKTKAKFKYFRYFLYTFEGMENHPVNKSEYIILINHSASKSGNHFTIIDKLKQIDKMQVVKTAYCPLSYGPEIIRQEVVNYGNSQLSYCFEAITGFMPIQDYYNIINNVSVAFFGHRRQEGAGNIFYLLASGAKVFLRRDNNLLQYLREKGYYVFEFESEFNSIEDLKTLDFIKQKHNRRIVLEEYSDAEIQKTFLSLINN